MHAHEVFLGALFKSLSAERLKLSVCIFWTDFPTQESHQDVRAWGRAMCEEPWQEALKLTSCISGLKKERERSRFWGWVGGVGWGCGAKRRPLTARSAVC